MISNKKIKNQLSSIIYILLALVIGYFCFTYGKNIPYEVQEKMFDALRNTSATIFTIMGIWIAVIYPDGFSETFSSRSSNSQEKKQIERVRKLLYPMVYSTIIFSSVLIFQFFAPIAEQISFFNNNSEIIRGITYAFLGVLTIVQLWTLFLAIVPAEYLLRDLTYSESKKQTFMEMQSRNQRR